MAKKRRTKRKHVPLRTCVACRESKPKRDMVRVVRLIDGRVTVDDSGKVNGRGAYLCRKLACWEQALQRGALQRALRIDLTDEDRAELEAYKATLIPSPPDDVKTGKEAETMS
jgi:hypothetical protein